MRRLALRHAAVVALALAATACAGAGGTADGGASGTDADPAHAEGSAGDERDGASSDELRIAMRVLPATLDPAGELSASYLRSVGANESLLKVQADGSVAPALAAGIEQVDATTWEVALRDDVTFWSGAPVDADAVVASLERTRELSPLAAGLLDGVLIEAADDATVVLTTPGLSPDLPFALSHYMFGIHNVERHADAPETTDVAVADMTGPFRIVTFDTGRQLVLERNDAWWGQPPSIERIVAREVDDADARAQLALAGQAHIVQDAPADRADELEAAEGMTLVAAAAANTVAVYLNPDSDASPALGDQRVREALAWALDREEVVQLATAGLSVPASSWLSSSPAYPDAAEQGFRQHDQARAEALLDAAGWELDDAGHRQKDGERLSFRLLTFGNEERTGEVLQAQWARLGVDVQVNNVDSTLITQAIEDGDWDAVTQAWTTLGATAELIAAQIGPDGSGNHGRYQLPEVPELLERARTVEDQDERTAAIYALNQAMVDHVPSIPVHPRVQATAVASNLRGFVAHPLQYENLVQPDMTLE
ncbi:ABC transporter substrate-binding protein [Nitriliruptor alkaliphilus]|uniref:ABC transporter substrate-binding protein n=1 Tax=Nitriliruptor alkaliphilus TaxID=427918 RepID=UPI0006979C70|nr:ABC transporter substrate-binding protein [Nitriliruptor alkaliphilus]